MSQAAPSLRFLGGLGRAGTSAGSPGFPAACGSPEAGSPAPASSGPWLPREPTGIWGFLGGWQPGRVRPLLGVPGVPKATAGCWAPQSRDHGDRRGGCCLGTSQPCPLCPPHRPTRDVPWHSRSPSVPQDPPQAGPLRPAAVACQQFADKTNNQERERLRRPQRRPQSRAGAARCVHWLRPRRSSHAAPDPRGRRSSPCQRRAGRGVRMDPPGGVPGPSASAGRSGRAGNRPAPGRVCGSRDGGSSSERWDGVG